ncbi:MAG: sulfatase-like hydrolase/transferase [Verrucomicrobiota bacterium]
MTRKHRPPNILFIIMDDVGIDQLSTFNPFIAHPVPTPAIDTLVRRGVSFNNCWMMPECSPSRSCFFTGRFPLRTGVDTAILDYDLPAAQVSPYEMTTPRVLARAGYSSALIGKYHLGGPSNNPDGFRAPAALGWNYFNGNLHGGPPSIDATLGGQTTNTALYPCGFPTGSQRGVGWFQKSGKTYCDDNNGAGYTGHECVMLGGIPALTVSGAFAQSCAEATLTPDFTLYNGYYVWPRVVNEGKHLTRSTSREYMSIANTDDALEWIQRRAPKRGSGRSNPGMPWMCTVSYNSIHTPYQQPPTNLYPPGFTWPVEIPEGGTNSAQIKVLSDLMLYAMDQEIGRLLVGAGLATRLPSGDLEYTPEATDTMIVLVGDNGTYLSSVNTPYNPLRSKSSPYQTGVCAPMVVAGPLVSEPGRTVTNMVNAVDLFQLFGEIAGLDVHKLVPASHTLDCQPILPYLTNPNQGSFRTYNFSQLGDGVKPSSVQTWPSVFTVAGQKIGNDILFNTAELCADAGGEWFGPGAPVMYTNCCDVRANVYPNLIIQPSHVWAVRNDRYKLVKSERASCDSDVDPYELYDLQPTESNPIGLDNSFNNLLQNDSLTPEQSQALADLQLELQNILNSEPQCSGDGNLDKVVNHKDVSGVHRFWGQPSVFDFNQDGTTDQQDLDIALANKGHKCLETVPE